MKFEVVITSGKEKNENQAPIGIYIKEDKNNVILHLYEGSHTYNNLKKEDFFIINICSPYLIAKAVLDDNGNYGYLTYKNTTIPYLKESYKILLIKINNRKILKTKNEYGNSTLMIVEGNIILEKDLNPIETSPYNRADGLIVEIAVLYSRLNIVPNNKRKELMEEMKKYFKTIKKVGSKKHIELGEKFLKMK
jgi:hypothetical protein